jgi:hypothetical protein
MRVVLHIIVLLGFVCLGAQYTYAQQEEEWSTALDSARAKEDNKKDSVEFTARYVRYATLAMLKRATHTVQIDTSHRNFQYYNKQNLPWDPSSNLGSYGLATRDLLFTPSKKIGFESGFHALERYLLDPDSVHYYRARARYSELYAVGFFFDDQVFKAKLAQNINPRWNIGAEYHATNTDGYYTNQKYSDRKAAVFSWYESENHRYNLLINAVFNSLDATENGSITNDSIFSKPTGQAAYTYQTRLRGQGANRPYNKWKDNSFFLRQSYFLGRLDTVNAGTPEMEVHPTNAVAHNSSVRMQKYMFFKNEGDPYDAFPIGTNDLARDTTDITTVSNEFTYAFYFRPGGKLKNEAKLNLGFKNDLIWYSMSKDISGKDFIQNSTIWGDLGYKFSDRILFQARVDQIILGRNIGDYLYEAKADLLLSEDIGKVSLGAYTQNKSPEMIFNRLNYTYHQWDQNFEKTKTQNLSFAYHNNKLGFTGKVEYFLINNYLYFKEVDNPTNSEELNRQIEPTQSGNLNMLKASLGQNFKFGRFHFDNLVVYQKSDASDILAIPELYTWHSLYYNNKLYNVMDFNLGMDVKFNTPFRTPSYSINSGQFYNDNVGLEFSTYPIVDVWATGNIKRVNLFISYNFLNQLLYPKGYYTIRRYPMNEANLRFGVSWKFYD